MTCYGPLARLRLTGNENGENELNFLLFVVNLDMITYHKIKNRGQFLPLDVRLGEARN